MIQFEHVNFGYSSRKPVLKDINISLEPGHIYGLLGKNGVGKSTLFRLITGANESKTGSIHVLNEVPFLRKPSMMSDIFLFPEEINYPKLSVLEYGRLFGAFYPRYSVEDMENILKRFDIDKNQTLKSMSQGQRKKAYMSFALACNTRLLLMDEPTNGLDIPGKTEFRRILSEFRSDERLIIISTHQVRDLELLIDAVMILDECSLVMCETADKILNKFHFGDVAECQKLIFAEETVRGKTGLGVRTPEQEVQGIDKLDLETLFNAVMQARDVLLSEMEAE